MKWPKSLNWGLIEKLTDEERGDLLASVVCMIEDIPFDKDVSSGVTMALHFIGKDIQKSKTAAETGKLGGNPALKKGKRSSTAKKKPAQAAQVDGQDVETQVQEPEQEAFIQIILNDGTFYPVTMQDVEEFRQYYPAVDVESEIRKVAAWSKNNPTKRKTRGGVRKFINGWLSRAQDKGGSSGDEYMKPQGQQAPMVKPYYESPFKLMWQAELAKEEAEKQNAGS